MSTGARPGSVPGVVTGPLPLLSGSSHLPEQWTRPIKPAVRVASRSCEHAGGESPEEGGLGLGRTA